LSNTTVQDDSGLGFECLNGFPGVYIKCMLEKLLDTGIATLVHKYADHRATATCTLGVITLDEHFWKIVNFQGTSTPAASLAAVLGAKGVKVACYEGQLKGEIVAEPRGNVKHGSIRLARLPLCVYVLWH
jgi:inosine/xanthosine triphosphate pyrophosphatase family protein